MIILVVSAIIALIFLIIQLGKRNENYFIDKNVKYLNPVPWFGNTMALLLRNKSQSELIEELYKAFPNEKIYGFFDQLRPGYILRDPELIKQLTIKNFSYFENHRVIVPEDIDPILGKMLVTLQGDKWREMRSMLSPAFTRSKMKLMFDLVLKCTTDLIRAHNDKNKTDDAIEVKHFFTRFTNDIIATCAFGLEVNSIQNEDNEFFKMGSIFTNVGRLSVILKFIGYLYAPKIMKLFKITFFSYAEQLYFRTVILEAMKVREEKNIVRPDLINLLMIAKQGKLTNTGEKESRLEFSVVEEYEDEKKYNNLELTDDVIVAQCLIFFMAGFDTVATTLTFMAYEAAVNPDIQQKLLKEIDQFNERENEKSFDYDTITKMKYLDQFVSETLRKWPPAPVTDRVCNASFDMKFEDKDLHIKESDLLWIPIYGIHHDPKYYPNPEKFDPERFNDERKYEINPLAYLPFGTGPRNCIGSRFALMEVKTVFYNILLNFTFEVCDKTEVPPKCGRRNGRMTPDNGIWLSLKSRVK